MNKKIFSLFLLTAILALNLVLASSFTVDLSSASLSQSKTSQTFSVAPTNTSNPVNLTIELPVIRDEQNNLMQITSTPNSFTDLNSAKTFTINTSADYSKMIIGKTYSGAAIVRNSANTSETQSITLNLIKSYCDFGEKGTNLSLTRFDINNIGGDDEDWLPLDEIEVRVRVENNNPSDGARIDTTVELALYDSKGKEQLDLDKVDLGRIKGDDNAETTFAFTVPSDLGADDSSYKLVVKAYQDGKKEQVCTSAFESELFQSITISREDSDEKQIKIYDTILEPVIAQCKDTVSLKTKVANVGDRDQDEIKIKVYNKDLGLNTYKIISGGLTQDDSPKLIEFTFEVPSNMTEKTQIIELRALYDFNDDYASSEDAAYDENSDATYVSLGIKGNCASSVVVNQNVVQLVATLESEAKAGEEMIVRANVKNIGTASNTFLIIPTAIEGFSTLGKVDPQSLTLAPGASQDVLIYLKVNSGASGEQKFNINAIYGGNTKSFAVSPFTIQAKTSLFNLSFFSNIKDNWFIWIIVLINVVLIVLIIVVAIRIARK